jgi:dTDP-4-amino-4,6-dideoxygalactose transaminase
MDRTPRSPAVTERATTTPASIPITKPLFGQEELEAIRRPLETGWVVQGPFVESFEGRFSAYTEATHSVASSSCTTALHLAVAALGLKPGDEVIVPAFTWVATANVVEYMGATPIFCDIDSRTYNIDVGLVPSLVGPRTVGIIPVHLFGLCADMDPILEIARAHGLWVVEDAACALGAWYEGRHAGTMGDAGCFSFHPRKSITTGEGGMLTTARDDLDRLTRSLRDHGASRSDLDRHTRAGYLLSDYDHLGYNYRMTDIQGALGCAQMDRVEMILEARRARAARYDGLLADIDWLVPPDVPQGMIHGYQAYVCLFRPSTPTMDGLAEMSAHRNALMARMEADGIATRQGTHSPILQGFYREKYGLRPEAFPASTMADGLTLALPLYPQMTDAEQDRVIGALRAFSPG